MSRRTNENTLWVRWSEKEKDLLFGHPSGISTSSDSHLMHYVLSCLEGSAGISLVEELKARGYDITTLRISIMKDLSHPRWNQ